MTIRWGLLPLLVFAVGLVPGAAASPATINATGVISGSGTGYSLRLTNTGTDPLRCMSLALPAGVTATGASGPPGSTGGITNGGTGFGFQQLDISQDQSASFDFTTVASYPAGAGGDLRVSSDCQAEVVVRATGPAPSCKCQGLGTKVTRSGLNLSDRRRFQFQLVWSMTCASGDGGCEGEVDIGLPRSFRLTTPQSVKLSCTGPCGGSSSQALTVSGTFPTNMRTAKQRRNKTVIFAFKSFCIQDGARVAASNAAMTVVYNKKGLLDRSRSDLDANGLPDGKNRK